jgi:hypothetical protein
LKPYYEESGIQIFHGDFRDVLPVFTRHQFDLVFFDPPYNVGKDYGVSKDNLPAVEYQAWAHGLCVSALTIAKDFAVIIPNANPGPWCSSLVPGWPVAMKIRAGNAIRRNWENKLCLLWTSIQPELRQPNIWEDLRFKGEGYFFREQTFDHPGYTPECVTRRVLALRQIRSVVDPCVGTGTTLAVAKALGIHAVGIELDERWREVAAKRLSQEVLQFEQTA